MSDNTQGDGEDEGKSEHIAEESNDEIARVKAKARLGSLWGPLLGASSSPSASSSTAAAASSPASSSTVQPSSSSLFTWRAPVPPVAMDPASPPELLVQQQTAQRLRADYAESTRPDPAHRASEPRAAPDPTLSPERNHSTGVNYSLLGAVPDALVKLPDSTLFQVMGCLPPSEMHRFAGVCARAHRLVGSPALWRQLTISALAHPRHLNSFAGDHDRALHTEYTVVQDNPFEVPQQTPYNLQGEIPHALLPIPAKQCYYITQTMGLLHLSVWALHRSMSSVRFSFARFSEPVSNENATYRIFVHVAILDTFFHFEADMSCDVEYLKRSLEETTGLSPDAMVMIYNGVVMTNSTALYEYGLCYKENSVENHISVVHVILSDPGLPRRFTNKRLEDFRHKGDSYPILLLFPNSNLDQITRVIDGREHTTIGAVRAYLGRIYRRHREYTVVLDGDKFVAMMPSLQKSKNLSDGAKRDILDKMELSDWVHVGSPFKVSVLVFR